jgi:general secretion pathway protein D
MHLPGEAGKKGAVECHIESRKKYHPRRTPIGQGRCFTPRTVDQTPAEDYISGVNRRLGPLLFLSLLQASVWAQNPTNPPSNLPAYQRQVAPLGNSGNLPGGPGGPPIAPQANPAAPSELDQVRLQFPNTDIQVILKLYEQLTGKHMIYDNTVAGTVSIDISKPVTNEEAVRIIETSLYLNGFALVPAEGNIVKVVGAGKNPRNFGINIYSDLSQIPDDVSIATVIFDLQYADSKDMKAIVDQYVSNSIYTSTVPLPGSLVVTESTIMLRNIAKVIEDADIPPAEVVSRFYSLQRANAKDVLDKLNKLFEKSTQGNPAGGNTSTAPIERPILQPNGQPAPPGSVQIPAFASGLSEDSIIVGKIKVDYDERTNRIHVVTRPINLPFIENLIRQYDSDIQFGEPVKRPLKYVDAGDILDVIVKAITEPGEKPEEEGASSTTPQQTTNTQPANNTTNGGEVGGSSSGAGGGLNVQEELETPQKDLTPKAVTVGNTKIIADPRENTIIVLGNDEVKQKIFTLLDQLDVRAPQVVLRTVIGEFTLNNDSNFGIDYLLHYPSGPLANLLSSGSSTGTLGSTGFLNGNSGAAISQFTGSPLSSTLGSALGAGTGFSAAIGAANSLDIIVNALESTGRFHVTNQPMVYTSNNKKAIIVSGEQIPVPTSTLSNLNTVGTVGSTAAVQSSIDYMQVALQLEVVPLINSDREVNMDILQKLDSPSGVTTNVGGSNVPTITTRYIRTNVSVPNKATVVLGGLITKTVGGSTSSLPLLGRIPVIGYLFGNHVKQNDRSELIILIQPTVTNSPAEMEDESHVEREHLLMEPDVDSTISPKDNPAKGVNFRYDEAKQTQ